MIHHTSRSVFSFAKFVQFKLIDLSFIGFFVYYFVFLINRNKIMAIHNDLHKNDILLNLIGLKINYRILFYNLTFVFLINYSTQLIGFVSLMTDDDFLLFYEKAYAYEIFVTFFGMVMRLYEVYTTFHFILLIFCINKRIKFMNNFLRTLSNQNELDLFQLKVYLVNYTKLKAMLKDTNDIYNLHLFYYFSHLVINGISFLYIAVQDDHVLIFSATFFVQICGLICICNHVEDNLYENIDIIEKLSIDQFENSENMQKVINSSFGTKLIIRGGLN